MKWIAVEERLPDLIEGKDYSENVLVACRNELMVMQRCFIKNDDDDWVYYWCNCYGNINGDGKLDDEYNPTHWMSLPEIPKIKKHE